MIPEIGLAVPFLSPSPFYSIQGFFSPVHCRIKANICRVFPHLSVTKACRKSCSDFLAFHNFGCVYFGMSQVAILLIYHFQSLSCFLIQSNAPVEVEGEKRSILFFIFYHIFSQKIYQKGQF